MKYLRLTARPPPAVAPRTFRVLAGGDAVREARAVAFDVGSGDDATVLAAVDGERDGVVETLTDAPEIRAVDTAPAGPGGFYLLLRLDPSVNGTMTTIFETLATPGLVPVPPLRYRDGAAHARIVGEAAVVSEVVASLPSPVDVTVREVGERGLAVESAADRLSDRQREALLAALDLGYYDRPRRATHEDVAERLGCAASTAGEHLHKAEATLVRSAMGQVAVDREP